MDWWTPQKFAERRPFLEKRAALIRAVRSFFDGQGFYAVETPVLQVCPVMDAHIHALRTELSGVDLKPEKTLYLHTSPEFAMKKLLVAGLPKLYQICPVFRDAERSRLHSPEFTMLEWYRAEADYRAIMDDCIALLRHCAASLGLPAFRYGDCSCDPFAQWQIITVCEAFQTYAGLDLAAFLPGTKGEGDFAGAVRALGLHTAGDDRWDDLFFRVMAAKIEPFLGRDAPAILYDYPVSMASLSRRKQDNPALAERFELYVCGIELANAFSELTDPAEQEARFHAEMDIKERLYGVRYPLDRDFIAALTHGLPESGGIALGVDRLAMLASGAETIEQVLWAGAP